MSTSINSGGPRYRVVSKAGVYSNGNVYPEGSEIAHHGWPIPGLEPANDAAKRIARYYGRTQAHPGLPGSPWDAKLDRFYLPGIGLPGVPRPVCPITHPKGSEILGYLPESMVDHGLAPYPEYEMLVDHHIGRARLHAGERFKFIGWPDPGLMTPVNVPARKVAAYFAEHKDHPDLPARGPWCWFAGLHLPPLAKRGPKQVKTDTTENAGAIASEIEHATGRPGSRGGMHFGAGSLPPYADPAHKHLFSGMRGTAVNRAAPISRGTAAADKYHRAEEQE